MTVINICRHALPGTEPVEESETMHPSPPGALIPNTCPNFVEQSFENTKAVGVATVHSAKAIGTTTN